MKIITALQKVDCDVLQWTFLQRQRPMVVPAARWLSRTGDGYLPVLTMIIGFSMSTPLARQLAWQICILFIVERLLYFLLKNTLKRERPANSVTSFTAVIVASDKFSFPSGHTSAATLYASIIYLHFPLLGTCLYFWAAGVGASRVVLGVHYPSDILAGASLGVIVLNFL